MNRHGSYVVAPDLWGCLSSRSRGKRPPRPISASAYVSSKLQRLLLKKRVVRWDLLTSTDASTLTTTRTISRGLLGGTALVAFPASGAITESYTAAISISETCVSQTDCRHGIVISRETEMAQTYHPRCRRGYHGGCRQSSKGPRGPEARHCAWWCERWPCRRS